MSNFVIVPDKWHHKTSFWDYNYQFSGIGSFKDLYERDDTEDKSRSSNEAWVIWLLSDPSPKNRIWRLEEDIKKESIKYWYPDVDLEDELLKECIANYNEYALTPAARAFKAEEAKLTERAELIANSVLTLDEHVGFDKMGRAQIIPGTMKEIDAALKNGIVFFKNLETVKRMFLDEFENNGRVWGGRLETFREKGELPTKEELGVK